MMGKTINLEMKKEFFSTSQEPIEEVDPPEDSVFSKISSLLMLMRYSIQS